MVLWTISEIKKVRFKVTMKSYFKLAADFASRSEFHGVGSATQKYLLLYLILIIFVLTLGVIIVGPCRVPGDPTDESCTRFRFAGSITRIGNFILINYDAINKTDRKTYHWKRQNISFATRYPLN